VKHHRYNVKEAVIALVLEDLSSSQTGVVNGPWYPYQGLQTFGYQVTPETQRLITEGIKRAEESTIDDIPVTLEYGQFTPDVESILLGTAAWYDADGNAQHAITQDFGSAYVSLKVRVDKIGINGADVVYEVPLIKASGLDRSGQQRNFAPNRFTVGASFTNATYPVYKDGVKSFASLAVLEKLRPAGAALYSAVATAPTVTSINTVASGNVTIAATANLTVLFSMAMNVNSCNDLTIRLKDASGDLIPAVVTPTTTGVNAYREFVLNPSSSLASENHTLEVLTVCRSRDNVRLAAIHERTIVIS
jgi:hypothetical protein